jgi:hypothetical protein
MSSADSAMRATPVTPNDVGGQFGFDAAGKAGGQQGLAARRTRTVELAEQQPLHRPGLADHPGRCDRRRDIADTAHQLARIERGAQVLVLQHPVLERDDGRVRPHQRADLRDRLLGVPQLHAQHDDVGDADLRRVVGGMDLRHVQRLRAFDVQAVPAHGLQVPAARDEMHVGAALHQAGAEVAAQPARTHDRDAHGCLLFGPHYWLAPPARLEPSRAAMSRRTDVPAKSIV